MLRRPLHVPEIEYFATWKGSAHKGWYIVFCVGDKPVENFSNYISWYNENDLPKFKEYVRRLALLCSVRSLFGQHVAIVIPPVFFISVG